jgi:hypothetical protein
MRILLERGCPVAWKNQNYSPHQEVRAESRTQAALRGE